MSIVGASADHPIELFRMKHAAEEHLRASGAPWTIVRATAFAEFWLDLLDQTAGASGRPGHLRSRRQPDQFCVGVRCRGARRASGRRSLRRVVRRSRSAVRRMCRSTSWRHGLQRAAGARRRPDMSLGRCCACSPPRSDLIQPNRARQMRAAIAMDTIDLTFAPTDLHRRFPELPVTSLADILANRAAGQPA